MSFLAFLVFGGTVGWIAAYFHPKKLSKKGSFKRGVVVPILLGVMVSAMTSILGQSLQWFQSGQMLEWFSAMIFTIFVVFLYKFAQKWPKNKQKSPINTKNPENQKTQSIWSLEILSIRIGLILFNFELRLDVE